ncbi:MAG: hypothetical protein P8N56_05360 [Schleiferiaceae bacterium]|nr:hypothetical protein [Schleiferiaceae bacterium]
MLIAIALAAAVHLSDSIVAQIPTGELIHSRSYGTWGEVLLGREKANMAGFGSVTYPQPESFRVHFRVYGDSASQFQQWKRLEALLDESLELQQIATWLELNPPEEAMAFKDSIIYTNDNSQDSAIAEQGERHISISGTHQIIAHQDSVMAMNQSMLITPREDSVGSNLILNSTTTLAISEESDIAFDEIQTEYVPEEEKGAQVQSEAPDLVNQSPAIESFAQVQSEAPKALVIPRAETTISDTAAARSTKAKEDKSSISVATEPKQNSSTAIEPTKGPANTTSSNRDIASKTPFSSAMRYALIFGSFGDLANAEAYLTLVKERFPQAALWTHSGMYRIASAYPYYPSEGLKEAKTSFPKTWVSPL